MLPKVKNRKFCPWSAPVVLRITPNLRWRKNRWKKKSIIEDGEPDVVFSIVFRKICHKLINVTRRHEQMNQSEDHENRYYYFSNANQHPTYLQDYRYIVSWSFSLSDNGLASDLSIGNEETGKSWQRKRFVGKKERTKRITQYKRGRKMNLSRVTYNKDIMKRRNAWRARRRSRDFSIKPVLALYSSIPYKRTELFFLILHTFLLRKKKLIFFITASSYFSDYNAPYDFKKMSVWETVLISSIVLCEIEIGE